MSTLEQAIALAAHAHEGQVDQAGAPYILHPLRVMLAVTTLEQKIAAVLHDVLEDTTVTVDELRRAGFAPVVIEAVVALTKTAGETRMQAARRAAANPIACVVKWADVSDNMDVSRITHLTAKDRARLEEYQQVKALLWAAIPREK